MRDKRTAKDVCGKAIALIDNTLSYAGSTFETVCMVCWVIKKSKMAKHHPDLIMCRKQPGVGKLLFVFNVIVYNQKTDSIMLNF